MFVLAGTAVSLAADNFGFAQRRSKTMAPEDPLVLQYLIQLQDSSSPEKQLLPSMEGLQAQTFNNALVAAAFIIKDERERAERILDFYAHATDIDNKDPNLQNFYYNGEARGFFQYVALRDYKAGDDAGALDGKLTNVKAYHQTNKSDRWMGDMVWLDFTYEYYRTKYKSDKYNHIQKLIKNLLISWYIDDPRGGGYIQHGWRKGDSKLHMPYGHHEGNIDCYALFTMLGEHELAAKINTWINIELQGRTDLPLTFTPGEPWQARAPLPCWTIPNKTAAIAKLSQSTAKKP